MRGEDKLPNVRWSPYVDAPAWPWWLAGSVLAAMYLLLLLVART